MYTKTILFGLIGFTFTLFGFSQTEAYYQQNKTYTYTEAIETYKELAKTSPEFCTIKEVGQSDYGEPIHLFILNKSGEFDQKAFREKPVLLLNNAIHPGEPCGVDASIQLVKNLLNTSKKIPENVIIAIIPIYNIGGAQNRGCCSRANQNGPEMYGFRGNSKNLDLNRDFIKADSKNTLAFYRIFHLLKPSVFIDAHTSNGADYQHKMTLITSQLNKMTPRLAEYVKSKLNPYLFEKMKADSLPMVPYVHTLNKIPDNGILDYLETPRYSTGYTNLFNTISYVTEAHMLKPYPERVLATLTFLQHTVAFMNENAEELKKLKQKANTDCIAHSQLALNWKLDTTQFEFIDFKGYTAEYQKSKVTKIDRLCYNRKKPFTKKVKYFNHYTSNTFVTVPTYYAIPQSWDAIVYLLKANDIDVFQLNEPIAINSESYYITSYQTTKTPFEGHYLHYDVDVLAVEKPILYRKGDYIIPVKNEALRFIVETLEPQAPDSYFAWNYFDAILQQKEWFSPYVFEDEAYEMLKNDPELHQEFKLKRESDSSFASNDFAQLYFLYKRSSHYEKTHNLYPITRINETISAEKLTAVE